MESKQIIEINTNSALKDNAWRSVLNGLESSWYLKHQKDYGSWRWIRKRLFIFALFALSSLTVVRYIETFHPHWSSSAISFIIYCISSFCMCTYYFFATLFILFYILRHISILDDAIGLGKEVKVIAYMLTIIFMMAFLVLVLYPQLTALIGDHLAYYQPIISRVWLLLYRILFVPINYMQTRWVVRRFGMLLRQRSDEGNSHGDPTAISLSTTKMLKIRMANETTLRLMDEPDTSLTPDEQELRIEMQRALMKITAFEAFMRFLLEVFRSSYFIHRIWYNLNFAHFSLENVNGNVLNEHLLFLGVVTVVTVLSSCFVVRNTVKNVY